MEYKGVTPRTKQKVEREKVRMERGTADVRLPEYIGVFLGAQSGTLLCSLETHATGCRQSSLTHEEAGRTDFRWNCDFRFVARPLSLPITSWFLWYDNSCRPDVFLSFDSVYNSSSFSILRAWLVMPRCEICFTLPIPFFNFVRSWF